MSASTAVAERHEEQVPATSENAAILSMIERAARDPAVDIDKFERLMAMRERVENRAREDAFTAAMSATQADLPQVVRDAKNDHTKSTYATLEAISQAITPIYTKHGFSLSFGTEPSTLPGHHRVTCIASHAAGHSRQYSADLPADLAGSKGNANKTPIQGFGSTMSYGRRYLTLLIFNIAMKGEDDDGNSAGVETITDEQALNLREGLEQVAEADKAELAPTIANFCRFLKVASLSDIPAERYDEAKAVLNQKRKAAAK